MFRPRIKFPNSAYLGVFVAVSAGFLAWSFATSFRLTSDEISLAWQANSTRLAILFMAGFAQCAGFAALKTKFGLSQNIRLYLCLVLICLALVTASIMSMHILFATFLVVTSGVFTFYLSGKLELQTSLGRLVLGVVLYFVFFISVAVYFAASTQSDGAYGGLVLWLFSNASAPSQSATWVLLSIAVLIVSLMVAKEKDLLAISAIAFGVGLVGPLIFLAYFALLVLPFSMGPRYKLLAAGLLGGTFIVVTSSITQLMFGGYAPALIIPLAFVSIPLALLYSAYQFEGTKQVAHNQKNRVIEMVLIAIIVAISLVVVLHVNEYAQGLI